MSSTTASPQRARPSIVGPDSGPEQPFPIKLSGPVIKGFGRGSRELGIPTANIPIAGLSVGGHEELESGVYFGWVGLDASRKFAAPADSTAPDPSSHSSSASDSLAASGSSATSTKPSLSVSTHAAVLSIGYNPFYANTVRSVEVHLMDDFSSDFYGAWLNLSILGYIRPEYNYEGVDKLIEDIRTDIDVARKSLEREAWSKWRDDSWLRQIPADEGNRGS